MKKILAVLLTLSMIFALASCGDNEDKTQETAGNKVEVSKDNTVQEQADSEEKEDIKADEKEEVKDEGKKEETKKEEPKKEETKKEEPKKEDSKKEEVQEESKPQSKPEEPKKEESTAPKSVAYTLADAFKANASSDCLTIANTLVTNPVIKFMGGAMEVEEGYLTGFDNTEIKGFKSGAMFAPMIGTIPFVGYVFELQSASDASAFINTLKSSANLRWNICTSADEMVAISSGNKVFFVMSPIAFEE